MLAALLVAAGRAVRRLLLLGPDGDPRHDLWLDEHLAARAPVPAAERPPRPVLTGPLPVNVCGADSLELLPGVGPVLAARLVASRTAAGPFRGPDDLQRVRGIGPGLAARLAPLLTFDLPAAAGPVAADSAAACDLH